MLQQILAVATKIEIGIFGGSKTDSTFNYSGRQNIIKKFKMPL